MTAGFNQDPTAHLADRLLSGLEAGIAAGGEAGPVHSAALIVSDKMLFYLVDLRIDWDEDDPVAKLRQHWQAYAPQMQDYLNRAINPTAAPSYGMAGDPQACVIFKWTVRAKMPSLCLETRSCPCLYPLPPSQDLQSDMVPLPWRPMQQHAPLPIYQDHNRRKMLWIE